MTSSPTPGRAELRLAGRYIVRRKLGTGAMGSVYLARDERSGEDVALKVLESERLTRETVAALQDEFRTISVLHHPQIARAYDFGYLEGDRAPFYTREYIAGVPLPAGPPDAKAQADPRAFLRPILDLLEALEYLHTHEILHLDVHAGNLIVDPMGGRGGVLIDFGVPAGATRSTAPGERHLGSSGGYRPASLAPELRLGEAPGPAADIYGAGRLLLYRITGDYGGTARLPREIPGWGARLVAELERIIEKALRPDPEQRFGNAVELREALLRALGAGSETAVRAEPADLTLDREEEIELIERAVDRAARGETAFLWIRGQPGIGKSRLLSEARWRAQVRGLAVAEARFLARTGSSPVLERLLRASLPEGAETEWLSALAVKHGGSSRERAAHAAERFFAEEGTPLVVLLDDLEHADRESELLAHALLETCAGRYAAGRASRGLAIIAASSTPPPPSIPAPLRQRATRKLVPLTVRTTAALLDRLLRPLRADRDLLARMARDCRGVPRRARQLARLLHDQYGASGSVPSDAPLPAVAGGGELPAPDLSRWRGSTAEKVLETLAVFGRPTESRVLAAACGLAPRTAERALSKLANEELVLPSVEGKRKLYVLSDPSIAEAPSLDVRRNVARGLHARAAKYLASIRRPAVRQRESLARHLLACGRQQAGRRAALDAAGALRAHGLLDDAVRLLQEASRAEPSGRWRLELAERISEIRSEAGDHVEAMEDLEPVLKLEQRARLGPREGVRIRRRLGVHCHRAGLPEKAVRLFDEAYRLADPRRDPEEIVFILSELAELRTFRGEYAGAEAACREGLALLEKTRGLAPRFRASMEVTLSASLGHLQLRRMELAGARRTFESALALARVHADSSMRALILNNLGIVYNQESDLARAERCFLEAESLLAAAGQRRALVETACNLAVIAAKAGRASESDRQLQRAALLLREHPGERHELSVELARALSAHVLGRADASVRLFENVIALARKIGDAYVMRFSEIYQAEAQALAGNYAVARRGLRSVLSAAIAEDRALLVRMAAARLLFLEALFGRPGARKRLENVLESHPSTHVDLPELWNELLIAISAPSGRSDLRSLERIRKRFAELGIPAGAHLARAALLIGALAAGDTARARKFAIEIERARDRSHRVLSVLEPLACAEASLLEGQLERAANRLEEANGALVGLPFLELDWRIELLRARVAERQGDRDAARHHLHRALQTREVLLRAVPARLRKTFLAHPRFARLDDLKERLENPASHGSTPILAGARARGLAGRSSAFRRLLDIIDRVAPLDLPVLITGEAGSGKELAAREIRERSTRRQAPFHALHCASLPVELFESELFGYEAGAFTGAEEARPGLLEYLDGGTLLLDEIVELPPVLQGKLIPVLDAGVVRPLGSVDARAVNVRFLFSSSTPPGDAVREGRLREDLYYRLHAVEVVVPPLRSRREDIPLLVRHFFELHARRLERESPRVPPETMALFVGHDWPGNVRELESVVLRLLVESSPGAPVPPASLGEILAPPARSALFPDEVLAGRDLDELRVELERAYLLRMFRETRGDLGQMQERLGVKRSNLYTWFRRVGIDIRALRKLS